jgi:heat shock protein HslJ
MADASGDTPHDTTWQDTTWILTGPVEVPRDVEVVMAFDDGNVTGFSGCNRFRGAYVVLGDALQFGPLAGTMMACTDEAMAVEHEVLRRLGSTARLSVAADSLSLLGADDEVLLQFRAQRSDELKGDWVVTGIHYPDRQAIISTRGELTLTIESETIAGNAGCNRFRGQFVVSADGLAVGPLLATRKFCADDEADGGPSTMDQEAALLTALERATGYRLEGSRLTLLRPDDGISVSLQRA